MKLVSNDFMCSPPHHHHHHLPPLLTKGCSIKFSPPKFPSKQPCGWNLRKLFDICMSQREKFRYHGSILKKRMIQNILELQMSKYPQLMKENKISYSTHSNVKKKKKILKFQPERSD